MSTLDLRPRSTTELIDVSIQLLHRDYAQLSMVTILAFLPAILLELLLPSDHNGLANIAERIGGLFASAGLAVAVSDAYLGRPVRATEALNKVGQRFGSVFGASFIQGMLVVFGLIFLILPGLIFLAWTFAMGQAVMIERCDAGESFTRSRELARGSVGRILGTIVLAFLIYLIVVGGAAVSIEALFGDLMHAPARVTDVIDTIVNALAYPFVGVVGTLLYYDQRIRKEGFDLEMLAEDLGGHGPRRRKINLFPDALR